MPYINQRDRRDSRNAVIEHVKPQDVGELTYCITRLILNYLKRNGYVRFQDYSDVAGALHYAQTELDRRKQFPYEDAKRIENGDVYE